MAVKTITIDLEAYDLLSAEKRGDESFSRVIKRRLAPECTARRLLDDLPSLDVAEDALEGIEAQIRGREGSPAESPVLDPSPDG